VNMGGLDSWVEFNNVYAGSGGICTLAFRYANGRPIGNNRPCSLTVNDNSLGVLTFEPTGAWDIYGFEVIEVPCDPGLNTIRITATTTPG